MWRQFKNLNFYAMVIGDIVLFAMAHVMAYCLRFDFDPNLWENEQIRSLLPVVVLLKVFVFFGFGLYRGMWRYTSLKDLRRLVQASILSSLFIIFALLCAQRFVGYSRAVFILDGVLTIVLTGGYRMAIRSFYTPANPKETGRLFRLPEFRFRKKGCKSVLIIGAGDAGEKMLREIFDNTHLSYNVVGFLDDDSRKVGRSIHGVPILGTIDELPDVMQKEAIQEIFIAIPSARGTEMRRIVGICEKASVPYKTLPGIGEIMEGKVSLRILRDVSYEDLLGRPEVHLEIDEIRSYLKGQTVLVTGCGGSIGSELCRQVIRFEPKELILLDNSEPNLFQIQMELHYERKFTAYQPVLGRIQDRRFMREIFRKFRPQVVFHAAAYKHVPMLERNPWEAVHNNIFGSKVVMETAIEYRAERFVLVSTDKAVRPTNVMGTSKRATELLLQSLLGNGTKFMAVRFGNVVGSSGSVIPLFMQQIRRGGPVTVTHPEVTRFFMSIPEAVQLILQAGALGEGGEIFILDMGTPVKIADMARDLIRLSGKEPDEDIEIIFTGLREGEKLYEELITEGEGIVPTRHEKILVLRANGFAGYSANGKSFGAFLEEKLEELLREAERYDVSGIKRVLREIVPEYTPQESECVLEPRRVSSGCG